MWNSMQSEKTAFYRGSVQAAAEDTNAFMDESAGPKIRHDISAEERSLITWPLSSAADKEI
jgi:hypothetical protein